MSLKLIISKKENVGTRHATSMNDFVGTGHAPSADNTQSEPRFATRLKRLPRFNPANPENLTNILVQTKVALLLFAFCILHFLPKPLAAVMVRKPLRI
jgi:hypothetical protein